MKSIEDIIQFRTCRWKLETIIAYLKAANMPIPPFAIRVFEMVNEEDEAGLRYIDPAFDSCVLINSHNHTDITNTEILKKSIVKLSWLHKEGWKILFSDSVPKEGLLFDESLNLAHLLYFIPGTEVDLIKIEVNLRKSIHNLFPNEKEIFSKALENKNYTVVRNSLSGHAFNLINTARKFDDEGRKLFKEIFYLQMRMLDLITDQNALINHPKGKDLRQYIKQIGWSPRTIEEAVKTESIIRKLFNGLG